MRLESAELLQEHLLDFVCRQMQFLRERHDDSRLILIQVMLFQIR